MAAMIRKEIRISNDGLYNEFNEFIDLPNNSRIIFSGAFGTGKTTFLREYFSMYKDKYVVFHLFPTNYTANRNEDVFELIKYDILYELLKEKPPLEKLDLNYLDILPLSVEDNLFKSPFKLLELLPKIGKPIKVIKEILDEKIRTLEENEGKQINNFANKLTETKGLIYEYDSITQIIINLIARIKNERKSILIIDDLDRIDPDNIFRLLNVFSVHLDMQFNDKNKFDFDTVIFCCDIENIRKIFHNRFGADVDFNGYIDKFYSTDIFEFENKSEMKKNVEKILRTIVSKRGLIWSKTPGNEINYKSLLYIINSMIESGVFSLRQLMKLFEYTYLDKQYQFKKYSFEIVENRNIYFISILDFLVTIFGGVESLIKCLQKTTFYSDMESNFYSRLILDLILLIDHRINNFITDRVFSFSKNEDIKYIIKYGSRSQYDYSIIYAVTPPNVLVDVSKLKISDLLIEALKARDELKGSSIRL